MRPDQFPHLRKLLLAAADLSGEDRTAFLDDACKDDPDLRQEIESLLAHETDTRGPVNTGAVVPDGLGRREPAPTPPPSVPEAIAGYRILDALGQGGMGVVYLAEQTEPVRRQVALKVMRVGMDTGQIVARFEAEKQALAMMDHPNIARVFDAGVTEDGRPYFVMEHVPGDPITEYCDRHQLRTGARLGLLIKVCEAVQHAHQKGIIHRDLKPSNVLVHLLDGKPMPKVIDFGIAKATSRHLAEETIHTEQGQLIGTPEYMSPEQADMTGLNVDTRSDIYSLGVMLYELIVGFLPFDSTALRRGGYAEIQRLLSGEDPPKPSDRLATTGDSSQEIATKRRTTFPTLQSEVRGDLDWITMKAMDKDRERRYASASELVADIRRHLDHEPVVARPPDRVYRLRKFVRRNRALVGGAAAVALALLVGIAGTTWQAIRASQAESEARSQAEVAAAVNEFLTDMLKEADPERNPIGREPTVLELLDGAADTIDESFDAQPEIQAEVRSTIGRMYKVLGRYDESEVHLRSALEVRERTGGPADLETARSQADLGDLLIMTGEFGDAEPLLRAALETRLDLAPEDALIPSTLIRLGSALDRQGRYAEAESLYLAALSAARRSFGEEHVEVAEGLNALAYSYHVRGLPAEAESLAGESVAMMRRLLGSEDLYVAEGLTNLAFMFTSHGKAAEAEPLSRESLAIKSGFFGREHPATATSLANLAATLSDRGKYVEAESLYYECLAIRTELLGSEHPHVAVVLNNLGHLLMRQGKYAEAEARFRKSLAMRKGLFGNEHPDVIVVINSLASVLQEQGRLDEAEPLFRESLAARRAVYGEEHPSVAKGINNLALLLRRQEKYEEAERLFRQSLELRRKIYGEEHRSIAVANYNLALVLRSQDRHAVSDSLFREAVPMLRRALGDQHPSVAKVLFSFATFLKDRGVLEEAEPLFRECIQIRRSALSEDNWLTAQAESSLGECLAALHRHEEAESLLIQSCRVLEASAAPASQKRAALRRNLEYYESRGMSDQAKSCRARLASLSS